MKDKILMTLGILFLILWLLVGFPFEIKNLVADRIIMTLTALFILIIIALLLKLATNQNHRLYRVLYLTILTGISIIYSWIGVYTVLINYKDGPIWEDTQVYTNVKGQKIISQFRETSGSIYDYRERFIFYIFKNNDRISIEWSKNRMHGIWRLNDIKKDTTYFLNLDEMKNF